MTFSNISKYSAPWMRYFSREKHSIMKLSSG